MANDRNAGRKPKFKKGVKHKVVRLDLAIDKINEIKATAEKIQNDYLFRPKNVYGKVEDID